MDDTVRREPQRRELRSRSEPAEIQLGSLARSEFSQTCNRKPDKPNSRSQLEDDSALVGASGLGAAVKITGRIEGQGADRRLGTMRAVEVVESLWIPRINLLQLDHVSEDRQISEVQVPALVHG